MNVALEVLVQEALETEPGGELVRREVLVRALAEALGATYSEAERQLFGRPDRFVMPRANGCGLLLPARSAHGRREAVRPN